MYNKKVFFDCDYFTITLEELDGYLFAHVAIHKNFSLKVFRELMKIWMEIKRRAFFQGYEQIYTYTEEPRMFRLFRDGSELGAFERNGQTYKVWGWDLK